MSAWRSLSTPLKLTAADGADVSQQGLVADDLIGRLRSSTLAALDVIKSRT